MRPGRPQEDSSQPELFVDGSILPGGPYEWPAESKFPLNVDRRKVETAVWADLVETPQPLVVAGYASLDRLLDLISDWHSRNRQAKGLRLLFGHEPFESRRAEYRLDGDDFLVEAEDYWLSEGISLHRSAALIQAIRLLEEGVVEARYMHGGRRLHAKMYCAQNAATLGSSNFTEPGLTSQYEANARYEAGIKLEQLRYDAVWRIALNYWSAGRDYSAMLIELLRKLLRLVTWQEALARACAEYLEGEWADAYLRSDYLNSAGKLWPSQRQGIAQALAILASQDSVLVADATGAGKTRMGTYLIGAVRDDILRRGRLRQGNAIMVCPPSVQENWQTEAVHSQIALEVYSHGGFSNKRSKKHGLSVQALRHSQILCVDEGHNFLNVNSERTRQLLRNMADHVVMLTATPINRSVIDLLRIADMLGADNLEHSTLEAFKKMLNAGRMTRLLTDAELAALREEIQTFTVRRTKRVLNKLIDREPDAYRDAQGKKCRFPRHDPQIYPLKETEQDRALAVEIGEIASQLRGITHFIKPLELPAALRKQGISDDHYLQGRLRGAAKLARYLVMSSLRSSRAALIEHVLGTAAAVEQFELAGFKKDDTGNIKAQLEANAGKVPDNHLKLTDKNLLPDWLSDPFAHESASMEDAARYAHIAELAGKMSDSREAAKARLIRTLSRKHELLLAFDSRPITLAVIRAHLARGGERPRILVAWGNSRSDRQKLLEIFAQNSTAKGYVGLCSDSVSEGVNLQRAAAMVHLDMPSVVRIAEQRVGRIDRMDSPHTEIQAWWPDDAPEFALSSDERFVERADTVEKLLGSNMPLPEKLQAQRAKPLSTRDLIQEYAKADREPWDGIEDAFAPVRSLVSGPDALVSEQTYEDYRKSRAAVLSMVSLVPAEKPWAFFCVRTTTFDAPRWIFLSSAMAAPLTGLSEVSTALRARLGDHLCEVKLDEHSENVMDRFLRRLPEVERMLLSRKKQRALEQMLRCVEHLLQPGVVDRDDQQVNFLFELKRLLTRPPLDEQPDWNEVAVNWLDVIRPVWFERLSEPRRKKPLLLRDIEKELLEKPEELLRQICIHFARIPSVRNADKRVRACIIGIA